MCVAFFTLDHPDYALILCNNRDEYLSRPTQSARFHSFGDQGHGLRFRQPNILSGIDVQAGGTWLGLTRTGKLALLTNITQLGQPPPNFSSSRGHLVSSFLESQLFQPSLEEDVHRLIPRDTQYAGFNLLLLAPSSPDCNSTTPLSFEAIYVTNRGAGGPIIYRPLTVEQRHRGGLSNGIDGNGADEWPKVQQGLHSLEAILATLSPDTSDEQLSEHLFDLLTWRSSQPPRDRSELRNTIHVEPLEVVTNDYYATRLSTVVLIKRSGEVLFTERDRWIRADDGRPILADPSSQRVFRFKLEVNGLSE